MTCDASPSLRKGLPHLRRGPPALCSFQSFLALTPSLQTMPDVLDLSGLKSTNRHFRISAPAPTGAFRYLGPSTLSRSVRGSRSCTPYLRSSFPRNTTPDA